MTDIQYVQLESAAFLTDIDFQMMDAEQRGVYCSVILYLYCNEGRMLLSGDDSITLLEGRTSKLAQMSGCLKIGPAWDSLWETISHKFTIAGNILTHKRVTLELKRAETFLKAKSDAGKKGMKARWGDNTLITKVSKVKSPNSKEFRLSDLLFTLMLQRKPDFRKPNLQTWAKHIDRMIRLDRRKPEAIEAVIRWSQADPFWQNNILCTEKLRLQFDRLEIQMRQQSERSETTQGQRSGSARTGSKYQATRKNRDYANQESGGGDSIDNAD